MVAQEPVTPPQDLITALLGAGLVGGAMSDTWAHINILSDIQGEGFFTPWHGLLYGSFTASAAWLFWLAYRRRDRAPRWWVDAWPAGYALGAVALVIFAFAGLCDMLWHEVFGVEADIDGVLSPSHLLLGVGAVLLITSPLRSWWRVGGGGRRAFAGVLTLGLGTALAATFMLYVSAFEMVGPTLPLDGRPGTSGYNEAARGLASYLITTLVLVVPLLLAHQRRPVFGIATAVVGVGTCFVLVPHEFPRPQTAGGLAAIAAAIVVD